MNRRNFLRATGALTGLSMLPQWQLFASALFANGEMHPLRRNVGYYTGQGGTIGWLLTPDHLVVVDTQFPEQAGNLLASLRETNQKPVDLLINTHHHGDHTSGNIAFKNIVQTHVAHQNSRDNQERVARERGNLNEQLLPTTTFTGTWSQQVGDE
ncbi:MAG: MBL fold metallo-hydrolase, partial [Saprospiraceae bacterium]